MDDLKTFRSQSPIHIFGTAKFGNLQQNFEFDAIADYGGQTLATGGITSGAAEDDTTKIDVMKIVKLSDQVDWKGGNTTYPLTLKMQLRNDSAKAVNLQLKEYRKKKVTLAARGFSLKPSNLDSEMLGFRPEVQTRSPFYRSSSFRRSSA